MTAHLPRLNRNIVSISIIGFGIFFGGMLMLHTVPLAIKGRVANALLADFMVTFPVLFYLVVIRPLKLSAKSLLLVFSICCALAYLILPQQQRNYILQIRKLSMLAELFIIGYVITRFNKIRASYRAHQNTFPDPIYNLRLSMADVLGNSMTIKLLSAEVAVLRYGLLFWKKEKPDTKHQTFTTYKDCGYLAIWCVLFAVVLIEIVAVHLLLMKWNQTLAIAVTAISVYGTIIFIADLSAMLKRSVLVTGETIILRTGLRWRAVTRLSNIEAVQKITNDYDSGEPYLKGGALKNSGNVLINFKQPVMVDRLYGASKACRTILMSIDHLDAFIIRIS